MVGDVELYNDDMVERLGELMGKKPRLQYVDLEKSRPGHDRRYSLDGSKLRDMGWQQPITFDQSLTKTIDWMLSGE